MSLLWFCAEVPAVVTPPLVSCFASLAAFFPSEARACAFVCAMQIAVRLENDFPIVFTISVSLRSKALANCRFVLYYVDALSRLLARGLPSAGTFGTRVGVSL